jgi:hypothetical protein
LIRIVLNGEQGADRAYLAPKLGVLRIDEPSEAGVIVMPPVGPRARRGRQKTDFFVVADGRNLHAATDSGDADGLRKFERRRRS